MDEGTSAVDSIISSPLSSTYFSSRRREGEGGEEGKKGSPGVSHQKEPSARAAKPFPTYPTPAEGKKGRDTAKLFGVRGAAGLLFHLFFLGAETAEGGGDEKRKDDTAAGPKEICCGAVLYLHSIVSCEGKG